MPASAHPQQQEMPLAMVLGQPVLQIPQDLYIPPDALEVILDAFEGPLDLLLYLIRRQNLDILDIPVAEITRQYVDYIQAMQRDALRAGRRIPGDGRDPGRDQVADAAAALGDATKTRKTTRAPNWCAACRSTSASSRPPRTSTPCPARTATPRRRTAFVPDRASVKLPPPVDLREMLLALHDVLKRAELFTQHAIKRDALSVRQRMGELLARLDDGAFHRFEIAVRTARRQARRGGDLPGLLELAKEHLLDIVQEGDRWRRSTSSRSPSATAIRRRWS